MDCYDYLAGVESYAAGLREVATAVKPFPGQRVLDAGSGTGNLSLLLKAQGARITSCDFSVSALRHHRRKDPKAELIRVSLEERLPFKDASFDAICCTSVLFALSKAGCELAVREFLRVLQPGGRLIVTVAAPEKRNGRLLANHLRSLFRQGNGFARAWRLLPQLPSLLRVLYYNRCLQQLPDWQGYHRFSEEELRTLLFRAGFTELKVKRIYAGSFFQVTCAKLVGNARSVHVKLPVLSSAVRTSLIGSQTAIAGTL
jgi:ubiquinone/menaquinone biosynthesis C-methylase UbiE